MRMTVSADNLPRFFSYSLRWDPCYCCCHLPPLKCTWNNPLVALFTGNFGGLRNRADCGGYRQLTFLLVGEGIILALIQVGGLGYMTATTFLLLLLGRRLGLRERFSHPTVDG